jgi:ketol-acid reductoisomerase
VDSKTRKEMQKILGEIQDGTFAKEWITEWREGAEHFNAMRKAEKGHPVEKVGEELRSMMTWLPKPKARGSY